MKKLLAILALLIVFQNFIKAQKMTEEGNQWNIVVCGITPDRFTYSIRIQGDTIIDNKEFKKLEISNDSLGIDWTFSGIIREDSLKRVYLGQSEQVIYDFSLEIGDTFEIESQCSIVVLNVDSIAINNGIKRKRLTVENANWQGWGVDNWIEGIGSTSGILLNSHVDFHCGTDFCQNLLCFSQMENVQYPETYEDCWEFLTSTETTFKSEKVKVLPNPFKEKVQIIGNENIISISVYSISGNRIVQFSINKKKNIEFDTSNWKDGFYIINLLFEDGKMMAKKILKK